MKTKATVKPAAKVAAENKPKLVKRGKWYEVETPQFASEEEEAEWLASIDWAPIIPKLQPVRLIPGKMPPCEICGTPMRRRAKPVRLFDGKVTLNAVSHVYCPKCKVEKLTEEGRKEVEAVVKALKGLWNEKGKKQKVVTPDAVEPRGSVACRFVGATGIGRRRD